MALLGVCLATTACLIQSRVQGRYVEDQSACRDSAEDNIGKYEKPSTTPQQRNTQLVTLFANCMAKQGWQVARPKRRPPTTDGPHGPLDPYGRAATSVRTTTTTTTNQPTAQQPGGTATTTTTTQQPSQPAAAQPSPGYYRAPQTQAPVGQRPVRTSPNLLSPSGSMPPLTAPSEPGRYQPARPYTVPSSGDGSGAGRNF